MLVYVRTVGGAEGIGEKSNQKDCCWLPQYNIALVVHEYTAGISLYLKIHKAQPFLSFSNLIILN